MVTPSVPSRIVAEVPSLKVRVVTPPTVLELTVSASASLPINLTYVNPEGTVVGAVPYHS